MLLKKSAEYVFRSRSIPNELPSWVILVRQVENGLYEVYYDPHTDGWTRLLAQGTMHLQILQEMGFRHPEV